MRRWMPPSIKTPLGCQSKLHYQTLSIEMQPNRKNEFTAPGKSFLCMDLSQPTREQNRSHRCNSPPGDKDLLPCLSVLGPEFHRAYPLLLFPSAQLKPKAQRH